MEKYDLLFVPAFAREVATELDLVKHLDAEQKWGFVDGVSSSALTHAIKASTSSNDGHGVNVALLGAFLPRSIRGNSRRANRLCRLARFLSAKARRNPFRA
jgi:hypothetical protein